MRYSDSDRQFSCDYTFILAANTFIFVYNVHSPSTRCLCQKRAKEKNRNTDEPIRAVEGDNGRNYAEGLPSAYSRGHMQCHYHHQ